MGDGYPSPWFGAELPLNYSDCNLNGHKRQRLGQGVETVSRVPYTNAWNMPWTNSETYSPYQTTFPTGFSSWETLPSTQTFQVQDNVGGFGFEIGDPFVDGWSRDVLAFSGAETNESLQADVISGHEAFLDKSLCCFGMLSQLPIFSSRSGLSTVASSSLDLRFIAPNSLHLLDTGGDFGSLEERTAEILTTLAASDRISFQLYAYVTRRRAKMKDTKGKKVGQHDLQYLMNAIIFGPEEFCDGVGTYLAKCKKYLQDPVQCNRDVPYCNPHLLSRQQELVMTSSLVIKTSESSMQEVVNVDAPQDLFSQLCDDDHLQLTETPDLLRTPLYKHQKKALTFMKQREMPWSYEESPDNMWVRDVDETGELIYTNLVTGNSQRTEPRESKGGLLADQMGLGKSLTMISLIASNSAQLTSSLTFTANGTIRRIKSTLIVVPYSLLDTWDTQLQRHLKPNSLTWYRFHSSQKRKLLALGGYDIVITTYETLMGQQKKHNDPAYTDTTLFSFAWHRIVLDEAHIIRNRSTAIAQACCALPASRRWAITGTPIQNRPTDLGSLLEFIHLEPFTDPKVFESTVVKPWLKSDDKDTSRLKKLIRYVSLCRSKTIIDLPPRRDVIKYIDLGPEERDLYESAKNRTIQKLDEALSINPSTPGMYLNALEWLNELRLLCNHGLMQCSQKELQKLTGPLSESASVATISQGGTWYKSTAKKAFATLVNSGSAVCKLCQTNMAAGTGEADGFEHTKPSLSKCLTVICGSCIQNRPNGGRVAGCGCNPPCPKAEVSWAPEISDRQPRAGLPEVEEAKVSTKLKTLLKDLEVNVKTEKSVVFSFWTYTLDLIESLLKKTLISYVRIDGSLSGTRREEAIQKFQTEDSVRIILVSITCGGTGLDLTAASRAYLLEPQWNPMIEEQALSRIHRLGQTKEVKTIRYRVRNSFEEKVAIIQDAKKDIAAGAFSSNQQVGVVNSTSRLQEFRDAF